jgi:uncharacterized protein (DUF305 family)
MTSDLRGLRLVLACVIVSACGPRQPASVPVPESEPARVVHGDSAAIAAARADSMTRPYTAADVQFMTNMIPHHSQALEMSRMAPSHGANAEVQRLAARIINAQKDEVSLMQQWLADRQKPVPEASSAGHMHHGMHMPGMLTPEQMKELDAARGKAFDRLFVTYMIQHHKGAVHMVQQLFASQGAAQNETVFRFATDVQVDQTTEIARMERMLAQMNP